MCYANCADGCLCWMPYCTVQPKNNALVFRIQLVDIYKRLLSYKHFLCRQSCLVNFFCLLHEGQEKKHAFYISRVPMQKHIKAILVKNEITILSECSPHILYTQYMFIKYFHFKCAKSQPQPIQKYQYLHRNLYIVARYSIYIYIYIYKCFFFSWPSRIYIYIFKHT